MGGPFYKKLVVEGARSHEGLRMTFPRANLKMQVLTSVTQCVETISNNKSENRNIFTNYLSANFCQSGDHFGGIGQKCYLPLP